MKITPEFKPRKIDTKPTNCNAMPDRKTFIGGSDIAAICGVSPYKTALDVYLDKTSDNGSGYAPTETMQWGTILESAILGEWEARDLGVIQRSQVWIQDPRDRFFAASIDAIGITAQAETVVVEAKKIGEHAAKEWVNGPPKHYLYQVQWYLLITGHEKAHVCALFGGSRWECYLVDADIALQKEMHQAAVQFWKDNVEKRIPPTPSANDSEDAADGIDIASIPFCEEAVREVFSLRHDIKALDEKLIEREEWLKAASGGKALTKNGLTIGSWRTVTRKAYSVAASTVTQFVWSPAAKIRKLLEDTEAR